MPRRLSKTRRSGAEWAVRATLALTAAILGYLSVAYTLGYTLRASATERGHTLAPTDGRVTALMAQRLAGLDARPVDRRRADELARVALLHDPTSVIAASTLGLDAQVMGNTTGARRLFSYAEKLSRRELQTQMWSIEDAVGRGDVSGVLHHYDVALRTSRNAPDVLFPILASAISDADIRKALLKTMMGRPVWGPSFVNYASANAQSEAAIRLFQSMARAGLTVTDEPRARVVSAMITQGRAKSAWVYYTTFRPGANPRTSRDARFATGPALPTPFDWVAVNDDGMSASIQRNGSAGIFDFAAPPSVGGVLLRQVQVLPPGAYRLAGHSIGISQDAGIRPYWMLSCNDGRELGRVDMPNSTDAKGMFKGRFKVPSDCPVQSLMFVARPTDNAAGLSGQIDWVRLAPLR